MHHPLRIIHYASSIMDHPLCIIHSASSILHHPLCIIHCASSIMHHSLCISHYASSTMHDPLCIIQHTSSIMHQMTSLSSMHAWTRAWSCHPKLAYGMLLFQKKPSGSGCSSSAMAQTHRSQNDIVYT